MMFQEYAFMERFAVAGKAGFKAVEFMFPYDYPISALQQELSENVLKLVLFNMPAGNLDTGERGIAVDPSRRAEFRSDVFKTIEYAVDLGVPQVNCLVGKKLAGVPEIEQRKSMVENLRFAAASFEKVGVRLVVEHLNSHDMPGFSLSTTAQVLDVLDEVGHANAYLQYDVYHAQRMEGDLSAILRRNLPRISHVQISDNPGRHQPGTGEINYQWLLKDFSDAGYDRYVGLEYLPTQGSVESLRWMTEYGYSL